MTSIRSLIGLFATIALVAFAAHAEATKLFTLNMTPKAPDTLTAGVAGQAATATFANISNESGNANAGSLKLFAPSGITIKTPASSSGLSVPIGNGYTAIVTNNGSSIFLTSVNPPLKPFATQKITLTMTVDVTCGATATTWTASMSTGATGTGGQPFQYTEDDGKGSTSSPNTPVAPASCSISFVSQPTDAFATSQTAPTEITTSPYNSAGAKVQVRLLAGGVGSPGATPTVTSNCSVTGSATASDASGYSTLTLIPNAAGTSCTITASATGYGTATSGTFNIVAAVGWLGCTSSNNFAHDSGHTDSTMYDPDKDGPFVGTQGWTLKRHDNLTADANSNFCPSVIPYQFSFDFTTNKGYFIADKLGQDVIVEYVVVLPAEYVDSSTNWPKAEPHPSFASAPFAHNPPLDSEYVLGIACNNDNVDNTSVPTGVKVCVPQAGWQGVAPASSGNPSKIQRFFKVIDIDSYFKI